MNGDGMKMNEKRMDERKANEKRIDRKFLGLAVVLFVGATAAFYLGAQPGTGYPAWIASLMHALPFAFLGMISITFAAWMCDKNRREK